MSNIFEPVNDLKGIITVLNTPFTEDNHLDIPSLQKNIQLAIKAGVTGFLIPAMASEVNNLSEKEKLLLIRSTIEVCNNNCTVIGGTSSSSLNEMLKLGETYLKEGCRGILANIPYESPEKYRESASAMDTLKPDFLMLQDWDASGYGIPVDLIIDLFTDLESFKCLKIEVVPAGVKYSEILKKTGGALHLSGGWAASQMIEGLERGIHAFMPTGMHEIYCRIYNLYVKGKIKEARKLFEELLPVLAFSNQHLDISIHFFKRLLWKQGVYSNPAVRKPILPFDHIHEKETDRLIQKVIEMTERIMK
ncbi:MAG: dihydrodipicolinate synthase family protein [Spirochaetales bacterium]|nr:dihydrodipicolinate synthase family protein [Spirochaetales bacterium]